MRLTLDQACEWARRHDSRIGVTVRDGAPLFYFMADHGRVVETLSARAIVRLLRKFDRKPMPLLELHVSTDGPVVHPFHSRGGCAALLRAKYRAGLAWRVRPGIYQLHNAGATTYVLTKPLGA